MLRLVTHFLFCIGLSSAGGSSFDCDFVASAKFNGRSEIDYITTEQGVVVEAQIFNRHKLNNGKVPLFFIHGGFQSRQTWGGTLQCLDVRDRAVIVPSLRGHGDSQVYPPTTTFNFSDYVPDLMDVLDFYNVESAVWIGHSLGSIITSVAASNNNGIIGKGADSSDYVAQVVLIGNIPKVDPALCDGINAFVALFGDCPGRSALAAYSAVSGSLAAANDQRLTNQYFRETYKSEQDFVSTVLDGTCPYDGTQGILAGIEQPVSIFWGTNDYIGDTSDQQLLISELANAASVNYIEFDGIGHEIFWEVPQEFSDKLAIELGLDDSSSSSDDSSD